MLNPKDISRYFNECNVIGVCQMVFSFMPCDMIPEGYIGINSLLKYNLSPCPQQKNFGDVVPVTPITVDIPELKSISTVVAQISPTYKGAVTSEDRSRIKAKIRENLQGTIINNWHYLPTVCVYGTETKTFSVVVFAIESPYTWGEFYARTIVNIYN
jgi:hypothetical protein